ncbi:Nse4 C-terminal-domain-containing protein [Phakopsora pachyrhizi]|uniref:Non-structural maintenance of chromosomes element 4 n=1 Tax=Phakopsora pachyrhizi TaxID=170000 RepID=A0AAV0BII7_PHAPC|nr:Nse4 C-terminal-domain-containing protein [Phakopsora pachyrhizi]CAH7686257.1 Nse4 C-terminal-domain-containing protein [Phakopsora pachyrhizi]
MKDDPNSVTAEAFDCEIQVLDENFRSNVKAPAEATLDSRTLRLLSETALKKSRSLKTELHAFDTDEFIQRFINLNCKKLQIQVGGHLEDDEDDEDEDRAREINWLKAGQRLMRFSRRAPTMDLMYGPLEIQHKKRKASQRTKIEKNEADRKAPEQLKESDIQKNENEISSLIKNIHEILMSEGGQQGMNLFKFFINPNSFSQSVENLFCLSFLIRDGRVAIDVLDADDNPLDFPIVYASLPADLDAQQDGHKKTQAIIQLEMKDWEDAINAFSIEDSVIPHREDPKPRKVTYSQNFENLSNFF